MGDTPEPDIFKALKPRFSPRWCVWDHRSDEYLHDPKIDSLDADDYEPIYFDSQEDAEAMARLLNSWEFSGE